MPQARNAGGPFHSRILPPRVTQMDEIQEIIPLLFCERAVVKEGKEGGGEAHSEKGAKSSECHEDQRQDRRGVQRLEEKRPIRTEAGLVKKVVSRHKISY